MSRAVLADTGPLYAALNPRDQYHKQAQSDLLQMESDGWEVIVIMPTVLETYTLILRNLPVRAALQWLDELERGATLLHPAADDYRSAFSVAGRYLDQQITLFDALVYVVSDRLATPVWTYDHHFDILGATRWYTDNA